MPSGFSVTQLQSLIRAVPDFPTPGVMYRDLTPLLGTPGAIDAACGLMAQLRKTGAIAHVVGIESRGFLFGPGVAARLGAGFVPARKPGKLPHHTVGVDYGLEYGTDRLEVHRDSVGPGDRVVVVDDVLATGGTAAAACELVTSLGAEVAAVSVLIEIDPLGGRERLGDIEVASVVRYR